MSSDRSAAPPRAASSPAAAAALPLPSARAAAAALCAALLAAIAVPYLAGYQAHDSDTRLYSAMVADLAARPAWAWCAPQWGGHWGRVGLFYEHPPGLFWLGASLVRLGLAAPMALFTLNAAGWLGALALLWRLGYHLGGRPLALTGCAVYAAMPAFLQYLVRGDQENPLTCAMLLGLWAVAGERRPLRRGLLFGGGLAAALLIKGLPALALLPVAAIYLTLHDRRPAAWASLGAGLALAAASAVLFDAWHRGRTGHSFWGAYVAGQVAHSLGGAGATAKLANLAYYLARPLWFGLPALLLLLLCAVAWRRGDAAPAWGEALTLAATMVVVFIGAFSLADRKADRYLFPMYPLLALGAAALALQAPRGPLRRLRAWLIRPPPHLPAVGLALLVAGVGIKVVVGTYCYRFIRLWPGA